MASGRPCSHLGKLKDALSQFDEALLIDPSLQVAQQNRAAALQKMGSLP